MPLDDTDLLLAAREGDRAALESLLALHLERIHAICRRITGDREGALDAAQEALIAIVRGLPGFDGRSAFGTWAHRVAVNAALDEVRRRGRRPAPVGSADDLPSSTRSRGPEPQVVAKFDVDRALTAIPAEFRSAVVLRDCCDLDYATIAEVLGVPVGTVRSRIARGRALLAETLGNAGPTEIRPTVEHP